MNIYDCDRVLASVAGCANSTDIWDKIILGIYLLHMEATGGKFLASLCQQIQAVYNKIELRNLALLLVIVPQIAYIVEGQGSFTAALGVPYNAMLDASVQFLLNSHRCEKLWISHNMLFQSLDTILIGALHISKAIFEQLQKSFVRKQRR